MPKKHFLVCLLFALKASSLFSQHDSTLCELAGVATIKMPGKANNQKKDNTTIYISNYGEFTYQAEFSLGEYMENPSFDDNEMYECYRKIIADKVRQKNGRLLTEESFFMEGFIGKHFIFTAVSVSEYPDLWYGKLMILNNYSILVTIGGYNEREDDLIWAKEDYFGTFRLIGDRENLVQTNQDIRKRKKGPPQNYSTPDNAEVPIDEKEAEKIGEDVGRIFGKIVLMAACIAGGLIIFLIVYFIYQRKKRN